MGDSDEFPISADQSRERVNLYGRTKQMSEADLQALAEGAFPALVLMKAIIYGQEEFDGELVGKETVIYIFGEQFKPDRHPTIYTPGTQARDFIQLDNGAAPMDTTSSTFWTPSMRPDAYHGERRVPQRPGVAALQ